MNSRKIAFVGTVILLLGAGVWLIINDNISFGSSIIGATIGVVAVRYIKQKKLKEMQAKGLTPYDERYYFISDKSSRLTLSIIIVLSAFFVLFGSVFGPEIQVNPYNFMGFLIATIIFIYLLVYSYYSKNN